MSEGSSDQAQRVLDASALLAWMRQETGADIVEAHLGASLVSTVNLSEVLQKSLATEVAVQGIVEELSVLGVTFVGPGVEEAALAAELWSMAAPLGLGIADRLCLATAVVAGVPVLTADGPWEDVEWAGLSVEMIR